MESKIVRSTCFFCKRKRERKLMNKYIRVATGKAVKSGRGFRWMCKDRNECNQINDLEKN